MNKPQSQAPALRPEVLAVLKNPNIEEEAKRQRGWLDKKFWEIQGQLRIADQYPEQAEEVLKLIESFRTKYWELLLWDQKQFFEFDFIQIREKIRKEIDEAKRKNIENEKWWKKNLKPSQEMRVEKKEELEQELINILKSCNRIELNYRSWVGHGHYGTFTLEELFNSSSQTLFSTKSNMSKIFSSEAKAILLKQGFEIEWEIIEHKSVTKQIKKKVLFFTTTDTQYESIISVKRKVKSHYHSNCAIIDILDSDSDGNFNDKSLHITSVNFPNIWLKIDCSNSKNIKLYDLLYSREECPWYSWQ